MTESWMRELDNQVQVLGIGWPKHDYDRLAGRALINVDRQESAAAVIGVEERELLLPIDPGFTHETHSLLIPGGNRLSLLGH